MASGMLGRKIGMTQYFEESGARVGVTVIELPENRVLQVKTAERDGYDAIQIGVDEKSEKHCTKPEVGHARAGGGPCRFLREIRLGEPASQAVGDTLKVPEVFEGVRKVKVTGVSKGKGFAGVMKRYHFGGYRATHGVKKHHRHPGSIGMKQDPGHVVKGKKMGGHMGCRNVTTRGIKLLQILPERNVLLLQGSIPGPNGGYVIVRPDQGYIEPGGSKKAKKK